MISTYRLKHSVLSRRFALSSLFRICYLGLTLLSVLVASAEEELDEDVEAFEDEIPPESSSEEETFVVQETKASYSSEPVVDEFEALKRARWASKPWYTSAIKVGNAELPFSPVTVFVGFASIFYLYYYWNGAQSYAEAAHILLSDKSEGAKNKLEEMKKKIGNDFTVFAKYAKEHSACPSGKTNGGNLGKFRKNDMAPPFDRAVFDPNTPLKTTIGPIQTQFGWHLIYVHNRQGPDY